MGFIGRTFPLLLLFTGSAGQTAACVVLDGPSFLNRCGYAVVVRYETQGADCNFGHGVAGPIRSGGTTHNPILGGCYVQYSYCEHRAWVAGRCDFGTPRPAKRRRSHARDLR
jgi:hypothetical protein